MADGRGFTQGTAQPFRPSFFNNLQEFGPQQNLLNAAVLPGAEGGVGGLNQLIGQFAGQLGGPDRGQLASQTFNLLREQSEPQFQQALQGVGRQAAALGRIGSGVTTSQLGDVTAARERGLTQAAQGLSLQAAGQTLQDRLQGLQGLLGAQGQLFGQGAQLRGEVRGERGFQTGLEQQAFQDAIQRRMLEDQLAGSAFGRQQSMLGLLGGLGFGGPTGAAGQLAGQLGQQAGGIQQGFGALGAGLPFLFGGGGGGGGGVPQGTPAPGGFNV